MSKTIFPNEGYPWHANLSFEHTLDGGSIFYDIMDEYDNVLPGHTYIVSSPHDLGGILGPVKVRANLLRGSEAHLSPRIERIRITETHHAYLPLLVKNGESY